MKRAAIVGSILAVALALAWILRSPSPHAPRFLPWSAASQLPATLTGFEAHLVRFDEGRIWLFSGLSRSNAVLYDTARRMPLGQLTNAIPVALVGDQLLCSQDFDSWPGAATLARALKRTTQSRYYLLDLSKNTALFLGKIPENRSFDFSSYNPSPNGERGLLPQNIYRLGRAHGFDLPTRRLLTWPIRRVPTGWWDDTHILFTTTNAEIHLFDVVANRTSVLVDQGSIDRFFATNRLAADAGGYSVTAHWNGRANDFFLTDSRTSRRDSYLIEIARPDGRLIPRDPRFRFEPNAQIDPSARFYLYDEDSNPEKDALGSLCGGLIARDLRTGTNTVLVPTDSNRRFFARRHGQFQVHAGDVYYLLDNVLWRAALDGSRREQVFPPPEPKTASP